MFFASGAIGQAHFGDEDLVAVVAALHECFGECLLALLRVWEDFVHT